MMPLPVYHMPLVPVHPMPLVPEHRMTLVPVHHDASFMPPKAHVVPGVPVGDSRNAVMEQFGQQPKLALSLPE